MNGFAVADCRALPLPDNSIDLIFTDPPYDRDYLHTYQWLASESARVLKPGGFLLAMCGGSFLNVIYRYLDDAGLTYWWEYQNVMTGQRPGCVWRGQSGNDRLNMPISIQSKPILAYSKGRSLSRTATCGLFYGDGKDKRYHAWGQDVNSARYYVQCFSREGDLVLDPFVGGGTTGAACKLVQRRFIGFDVNPVSVRQSSERYESIEVFEQGSLFAGS